MAPSSGLPILNGVIGVGWMTGCGAVNALPCMLIVVPWGIEPIRVIVAGSLGLVVSGTLLKTPGSKCCPELSKLSLMVCR